MTDDEKQRLLDAEAAILCLRATDPLTAPKPAEWKHAGIADDEPPLLNVRLSLAIAGVVIFAAVTFLAAVVVLVGAMTGGAR